MEAKIRASGMQKLRRDRSRCRTDR